MIAYAESSAVLAWLLSEPRGVQTARAFQKAELTIASVLTGAECSRAIIRGFELGHISRADARQLGQALAQAEASWHRVEISDRVITRARSPFPSEPLRTLDAIHLASALLAHESYGQVTVISLDERVRSNAQQLGMAIDPLK